MVHGRSHVGLVHRHGVDDGLVDGGDHGCDDRSMAMDHAGAGVRHRGRDVLDDLADLGNTDMVRVGGVHGSGDEDLFVMVDLVVCWSGVDEHLLVFVVHWCRVDENLMLFLVHWCRVDEHLLFMVHRDGVDDGLVDWGNDWGDVGGMLMDHAGAGVRHGGWNMLDDLANLGDSGHVLVGGVRRSGQDDMLNWGRVPGRLVGCGSGNGQHGEHGNLRMRESISELSIIENRIRLYTVLLTNLNIFAVALRLCLIELDK